MAKKKKFKDLPALGRYFFDTEFVDTGTGFKNDFISIGVVNEEGEGYYGISTEFNIAAAREHIWVRKYVFDKLDHHSTWKTLEEIRQEILDMIEPAREVEFWAKNGSYDNVFLCQLFGGMGKLRETLQREKGVEKLTFRDTKELLRAAEDPKIPPMPEKDKHVSINDAHQERHVFNACKKALDKQPAPKPII